MTTPERKDLPLARARRPLLLLALSLSGLALTAPARAAGAGDKAAAEAMFQQALALAGEKKFDEACKKFELSQQLDAGIGTLLYLADCYEQAGRIASSWATFKEAASAARVAGEADREQLARGLADALEPKLSRLTVNVATENAIDGFEVRRDGDVVTRGIWSIPVPVDPGTRHIEAHAPGRISWSADIQVTGPGTREITIPPLAVDKSAAPPPSTPASPSPGVLAPTGAAPAADRGSSGGTQRTLGFIVGGVGVVGLGVGAVLGLKAKSKDSDANSHCGADGFCDAQGVELGSQAKSAANVATFVTIGGAAAVATGLVLILTAPSGPSSTGSRGIHVALGLGPRGPHAGVLGSW